MITGGTGRLGTALCQRLFDQGYRLAVTYLLPAEAKEFEQKFELDESRLLLRRCDATNSQAMEEFFAEVVQHFGHIDGLAALVGGWAGGRDVDETDDVRFDRMLDLNLRSSFHACRAAVPYLKLTEWGRIVLVGSRAAVETPAGQAAFNIAKAGVVALGKSLARELESTNVTCSMLMPSVIDTPATRQTLPFADYVTWPTPEEIAVVAEFLLTQPAGLLNGATVPVYGKS